MGKPIYNVPSGFEGKIRAEEFQSVSCPSGGCCVDVYPTNDGQSFVLVNGKTEPMVLSRTDLLGLQKLDFSI